MWGFPKQHVQVKAGQIGNSKQPRNGGFLADGDVGHFAARCPGAPHPEETAFRENPVEQHPFQHPLGSARPSHGHRQTDFLAARTRDTKQKEGPITVSVPHDAAGITAGCHSGLYPEPAHLL